MKTFKEFIKEDAYDDEVLNNKARKVYPEFLNLYKVLKMFVDGCFDKYRVSNLTSKMMDGKNILTELKKYDSIAKSIRDIMKTFKGTKYFNDNDTNKLLKGYEDAVEGYKNLQNMYNQIFSYLKIGEPVDKSVPKLVEMCKKVKWYDVHLKKQKDLFFDEYSKEDILKQIQDFRGTVKLCGSSDLYVKYNNGKLVSYYF